MPILPLAVAVIVPPDTLLSEAKLLAKFPASTALSTISEVPTAPFAISEPPTEFAAKSAAVMVPFAILPPVTELAANSAVSTELSAILALVTALSAKSAAVMVPFAILDSLVKTPGVFGVLARRVLVVLGGRNEMTPV